MVGFLGAIQEQTHPRHRGDVRLMDVILFTGPRTLNTPATWTAIQDYLAAKDPNKYAIVVGDATGVDAIVRKTAEHFRFFVFHLLRKEVWGRLHNGTGPVGNALMAQIATDGVAVVPQGWV